jgi:hypothetical protein
MICWCVPCFWRGHASNNSTSESLGRVIVLGIGVSDCCFERRGRLFRCIGAWCDLGGVIGAIKASCLCGETFDAGLLVVGKVGLKDGPRLFKNGFVFPCGDSMVIDSSFA